MSKAKDRARAKSGLVFRNGSLVRREDVNTAVADMMAKKFKGGKKK